MKRKIAALFMGIIMVASIVLTGCGKSETTPEETVEDSEELDSEDAAEEQDPMEFMNGRYTFLYHHADFTSFEQEDDGCILSYTNENVEIAGSTTITFWIAYNTTYEQALADQMNTFGVTDYEPIECNFGADGITAYAVTYAPGASKSGLELSDSIYAIPDGEDTIMIDASVTVSPDEEVNMTVSDAFSSVLDTFALMDED